MLEVEIVGGVIVQKTARKMVVEGREVEFDQINDNQ